MMRLGEYHLRTRHRRLEQRSKGRCGEDGTSGTTAWLGRHKAKGKGIRDAAALWGRGRGRGRGQYGVVGRRRVRGSNKAVVMGEGVLWWLEGMEE